MAPKASIESLQPWHKRHARSCTVSIHSILILSSFVTILISLAFFLVADATVPASDMSLFNLKQPYVDVNGYNPVLEVGTFGYCIAWEIDSSDDVTDTTTMAPNCFRGNGYKTSIVDKDFTEYPIAFISRLAPVLTALHPLTTALVFLVLVTAALPCFIPPIFTVALSWLATASSIAAVGTLFSLALGARSMLYDKSSIYKGLFRFDIGAWAVLAGAISIWVFTGTLTTAWWLQRRSDRRHLGRPVDKSPHRLSDAETYRGSQVGELNGDTTLSELSEGEKAHRHELLDTDTPEQNPAESAAEEQYELDTLEREIFEKGSHREE
ncbi:hypothetical protein F5Y03DRAFT_393788 [Xylaria venustula]|nr:hypothetical protein F5Y03DRAFT_393788 [Xylaria venustula]